MWGDPQPKWARRLRRTLVRLLILTGLVALCTIAVLLYLRAQPLPKGNTSATTVLLAADGSILDELHGGQNRKPVSLRAISPYVIAATLAVEDRRFFEHMGFDWRRMAKAVYVDLKEMRFAEGASTITMQLARNLYLSHEKTVARKLKEAFYALQLELHYSKERILELYLNQIYYGHGAYGIQAAAQTFFGKDAKDLTLAESALLVGLPKGPSLYSPYRHFDRAKARQKTVLDAMVATGYLRPEEAAAALAEPLRLVPLDARMREPMAPYFRDAVVDVLAERYGLTEDQIFRGGLRVHTTLDPKVQRAAEEAVKQLLPKDRPLQVALVAVDPQTGAVRALVGGRDYRASPYNRAFARRQPGSTFKPVVYLAALENGFTPLTLQRSEPTTFTYDNGRTYTPKNFGDKYPNADIPLYQAIAQSDNIYAVKTLMFLGPDKVIDTARRLGITSPLKPYPSLALGSMEVTPFEMAYAYAALANLGERPSPLLVTRVEDANGNVLVDEQPTHVRVAEAAHAYVLTHMLQGVFAEGTGSSVRNLLKRPAAGKTGTTDYDAWLSGYTPQLAVTVWLGYDDKRPLQTTADGYLAKRLWATFVERALADVQPALFPVPDGVTTVYIDPATGKLATENCPRPKVLAFVSGTEPTDYCQAHLPAGKRPVPPNQRGPSDSLWHRLKNWWRP
ncbi:MAG: PBP1A family penicillin-binding protein [Bacillota bacterium]|nr:carboxypeptidase [Bacillota bacterium]